ncbi:MAG: M15 family metallopeptidase [Lactimicrobium sp.]|jgi:LAS superfamily LD-carboxypeptidase LdcB|uniref:M15 family metallopeptidase n=1 Tax=Lactimicrobium sp. TaxID=2563780 RepID=UPI002F35E7F5
MMKKKRRRYRINWDALKPDPKPRKKRRRHIRKSVLIGFLAIVIGIAAIVFVPDYRQKKQLESLGYNQTEISHIRSSGLTSFILQNKYYSPCLAKAILNNSFNQKYVSLYLVMSENNMPDEEDFLLYSRLEDKGYETDQLQNLFQNLSTWEITPLLVFDYQYNEQPYIDDCVANRDKNSASSFTLSNSYITNYAKTTQIASPDEMTVLVNKKNLLAADYVPGDLVNVDESYAIADVQMRSEAASAFQEMCAAAASDGAYFYGVLGYRSFDDQKSAWETIALYNGESYAEANAAKEGASEHQTGLAINIASTYESDKNFTDTQAYQWCQQNAASYGFIERYPSGKESITGFTAEPDHYRYVGKDIAQAVAASGLTYDEYYALYLAPWNDESLKPNGISTGTSSASPASTVSASPSSTAQTTASPSGSPQ